MAHQHSQQRELFGRELDRLPPPLDFASRGVELEAADGQHHGPLAHPAAGERAQPCVQLGEGKRLDQVIVGPAVQTRYAVLHRISRSQHQHR